MERTTVKLQGFNIDTFTFEEAVEYIVNNPGQVVTINPEMIQCAKKNTELADIINSASLVIPDGIGVEIGLKILGYKVRRIPGVEFARKLVDRFSENSLPVAFVGAKPEIINKAVENIKNETPSVNICYVQDGYFKDEERVLEELKNRKDLTGKPVVISHCQNPVGAKLLKLKIEEQWPGVEVTILKTHGLTSYYAQHQGLLIGF